MSENKNFFTKATNYIEQFMKPGNYKDVSYGGKKKLDKLYNLRLEVEFEKLKLVRNKLSQLFMYNKLFCGTVGYV